MVIAYLVLMLIVILFFNRNKKIILDTYLFLLISILFVSIIHYDIIRDGFVEGLLQSDDYHYSKKSGDIDYKDMDNWLFKVKNIGYYFLNYNIENYSLLDPVYNVKLFNTITFVISIYLFLNSLVQYHNKSDYFFITYIVVLAFFPLYLVLAINYKDSLLFSLILMQFSLLNYFINSHKFSNRPFLFILFVAITLSIESIRFGSGILFIGAIITHFIFFNNKYKISVLTIIFYVFCIALTFSFAFDFIFSAVLGRSFIGYREAFDYRFVSLTGLTKLDSLIVGFIKSVFQLNPITTIRYLFNGDGEHGYSGIVYTAGVISSVFIWMCSLMYLAYHKFIVNPENKLLLTFLFLYIAVYSFIYNGMIGFRLSFIMYLVMSLVIANIIYSKRKMQ
jgi:hypothetical protein